MTRNITYIFLFQGRFYLPQQFRVCDVFYRVKGFKKKFKLGFSI